MTQQIGLLPLINQQVQTLILGSLPSQLSAKKQQYYGNPRNNFWSIMASLYPSISMDNEQKREQQLLKQGIGLWDVIASADRRGSSDSSIKQSSAQINEFNQLYQQYPNISFVLFNGKTAQQYYQKHVMPTLSPQQKNLNYDLLPSSSPAHAQLSCQQKQVIWKKIILRH